MRQLILFFACVFYFNFCFSQGTPAPNYQQFGSVTTLTDFKGIARGVKGIIIGRYADTTTANLGFADFYPGAQIITDSPLDVLWQRDRYAMKWIRIASSSSVQLPSVVTIITDSSIQICNVNSCDTFVVNVTAQTINITNDSTIIVCSFGGSCDTITINPTPLIPSGIFVDSVFVHVAPTTDSLFYSKGGDTTIVHVFDRNCGLIDGGTVTYNSLLIFDVGPSVFVDCCTGNRYSFSGTQVTLAAAHVSLPRRDAIIVSASGISVVTGTPAATPADPQVTSCQGLLTFITVPAGATSITCATPDKVVYDENTTWTVGTVSVTADPDDLSTPSHLLKAINVGAVTTASKITFTTTSFDISPFTTLKFYVRLKAVFTNSAQITLRWFTTGGAFVSNTLSIPTGSYGFSRTTINAYQTISIPMSAFQFTGTTSAITGLSIGFGASNATGLYLDYIQLGGACIVQPQPVTFPNGFGLLNTASGAAIATQPNDIAQVVGTGTVTVSAAGKTLTINGATSGSTITIINDSTVQVCTALGSCQTVVFDDVDAQLVWVINDSTLLVCNAGETLCDTVDIPNPVFFDRAFFTPNQASIGNTDHNMNGNDMNLHGGTLNISDGGLPLSTIAQITPAQFVNDHTDLNNVKIGVIAARRVAGNGAAGLGIGFRVDIDNASSAGVTASNVTTEWAVATAGSETATMKFNVLSAGTLANRFSIEGSTRIIADGIRFEEAEGADVTAAGDLTLGNGGNAFVINGNTTINAILITNWQGGSKFGFKVTGTPLFKHNTAGGAGTIPMFLQGGVDFQAAANDYIEFRYIDGELHETNRKLAAAAGSYVFSNYITESPAGTVKLGGTGVDAITTLTADEKQILMTFNSLAGTSGLKLSTTSTAATGNQHTVLEVDMSGANPSATETTYGIRINNAHTGTTPINVGLSSTTTGNGRSVSATNTGSGRAVEAINSSTGVAVLANSSSGSGTALDAQSATGLAGKFLSTTALTTTTQNVVQISHSTTGTANTGFGGHILFNNETNGNNGRETAIYGAKWSNATDATRQATAFISAYNGSTAIEKLNLYAHYTTLTESTATAFLRVNVPSATVVGGEIIVTVEANDATDYQARTVRFIWSAVNKGGVLTVTINTPEEAVALSAGTLSATITGVDSGSNNLDFEIDATSSLTQTTLRANAVLIKNFGTGIITPQ